MRNKTNQFLTQEEIQKIESKGITLNSEIINSEEGIRMVVEILETISATAGRNVGRKSNVKPTASCRDAM